MVKVIFWLRLKPGQENWKILFNSIYYLGIFTRDNFYIFMGTIFTNNVYEKLQ